MPGSTAEIVVRLRKTGGGLGFRAPASETGTARGWPVKPPLPKRPRDKMAPEQLKQCVVSLPSVTLSVHSARTDSAPTVLVSLQPLKS